ncbi:MAG: PrsW family intramembrane metalloprotease [Lachnospiraceae bacterium]|nr:PrsW family intramembrane metalloprotease [Lachnospiraceae bacterium]
MINAENILICIAAPLLISVIFLKGSSKRFGISFLIGMIVCLLSAYIGGFINLATGMGVDDTAVFISPIIEEIMKFLPLAFYVIIFNPQGSNILQVAIGIGAGFATFENCCYIITSGAEKLHYVLIRGLSVGVMHIVCILALALAIVLLRRVNALSTPGLAGGLSLSMIFHALYNLLVSEPGLSSYVGYALPLLTAIALYVPYVKNKKIIDEDDNEEKL